MRNRIVFAVCAVMLVGVVSLATAAITPQVNYQAVLTASGSPVTSTVSVTFTIYDSATKSAAVLWTETKDITPDADGRFSTQLGSVTTMDESVFSSPGRYLGVQVGIDPEMSPRQLMSSAPGSFRTATIDGATGGEVSGDLTIKSDPSAASKNGFALEASLFLVGLNSDTIQIGPADKVILRSADDLGNEQFSATVDPVDGAILKVREPGGGYSEHSAQTSVYYGDNAAKNQAFGPRLEVGINGSFLFGDVSGDTLVSLSEVSSGTPELSLTNYDNTKAGVAGRTLRLRGVSASGGTLLSLEEADGSVLTETVVDGANETSQIFYGAPTAKNNFATGPKRLEVGSKGTFLFGELASDTLVSISEVSSGMPEISLTNYNNAKAGVAGRTLRLGGVSASGDVLFSIEDADGSILMETVVDGSGETRQIYYDVPTAKNNFATGTKRMEFTREGVTMFNAAGEVRIGMAVSGAGDGEISIYDGAAKSTAINIPTASWNLDGLTIFGATLADTNLCLFTNGNIVSVGQIAVGSGASGANLSTVFGFNNTASGDSSVVSGGVNNNANGFVSTISGGAGNTADSLYSTVSGGVGNRANGSGASVGGGIGNYAHGYVATVGGGGLNTVDNNYSTISGGWSNLSSGQVSTVGGGWNNIASGSWSTVSGGQRNEATDLYATVGGGTDNTASHQRATVGGGLDNAAKGAHSTVAGGIWDTASGAGSMIPGGHLNKATGTNSFAAGHRAKALHSGAFVWGDNTAADVSSSAVDQFTARTSGGARFYSDAGLTTGVVMAAGGGAWAAISDRSVKDNIQPVDGAELLEKIAQLEVSRWNYNTQDPSIQHIGPMAQDFYRLFGVGDNNTTITTIDPDGIALAAIQELHRNHQQLNKRNDELSRENLRLASEMAELRAMMEALMADR